MYGILGSVNYNVPFDGKLVAADLSTENKTPRRFNNVLIMNTHPKGVDAEELPRFMFDDKRAITFCGVLNNKRQLILKYDLKQVNEISVLLELFELKGIRMLEELKGVFAFALYDGVNRRLFLSRDRSPNRPLYLYNQNGKYIFSSELNTLVSLTRTGVDYKSIARCICLGDNYEKSTPYESITEIEHGHYIVIDTLTGNYDNVSWSDLRKRKRISVQSCFD